MSWHLAPPSFRHPNSQQLPFPTPTPIQVLSIILHSQVHLVSQHAEEFRRMLDKHWTITTLSGDMGSRAGFGLMARSHDLLICTAELLQLALNSSEEDEHVELTGEGERKKNITWLQDVLLGE